MTLILGSSMCAASQSVVTRGSSVADIFNFRSFVIGPACFRGELSLRLLRLDLLDRTAGVAPGGKTAADMRDRLQPHVLRGLGSQCRAHSTGAMKDEFLVALEDRLRIGAGRINPEFQHAAGAGERAGNAALTLDLAG